MQRQQQPEVAHDPERPVSSHGTAAFLGLANKPHECAKQLQNNKNMITPVMSYR